MAGASLMVWDSVAITRSGKGQEPGPGVFLGLLQPRGEALEATAGPQPDPNPDPAPTASPGQRPAQTQSLKVASPTRLTRLSCKEMNSPFCSRSPQCRGAQGTSFQNLLPETGP